MNAELEKKGPIRTTGRYSSVRELMDKENVSHEVRSKVAQLEGETRLTHALACMRIDAGLSQQQMAEKMNVSQSAISKLESQPDEDLKVSEIRDYCRVTSQRVSVCFGKPLNHVEAVKGHAFAIREHLSALAGLARQDPEIEQAIQRFFSEAFFNILDILGKCQQELPSSKQPEVTIKLLDGSQNRRPAPEAPSSRSFEPSKAA
jgi:transcriptional regulator with XRE-family HTH domain